MQRKGDDLEDDFTPDGGRVILSEDDEARYTNGEREPVGSIPPVNSLAPSVDLSRKRKRREKEKANKKKKKKNEDLQGDTSNDLSSFGKLSPQEVSMFLSKHQEKSYPKLSSLELHDLQVPASCIADTSSYAGPHSASNLAKFIAEHFPRLLLRLGQSPRVHGAPTLIYVSPAALRVIDIARILRNHKGQKGGEVAKLFAKHNKLQDHIAYLKDTKIGAAVGTPGRLRQLLENETLITSALTHVFLDITYRDAKNRTMLDIPETRDEVFYGILNSKVLRESFKSGKVELVLF